MAKEELKELSFLDLLNSAQIAQRLGMNIQDWMREVVDLHQHTLKYVNRCIEAYKVAQVLFFDDGEHSNHSERLSSPC